MGGQALQVLWRQAPERCVPREASLDRRPGRRTETRALRSSISRADAARVVLELATGLAALHDARIVHADVKPDNALVLAMALGSSIRSASRPEESRRRGARGWAAPEQILGQPVAPATDVFALGLLLARVTEAAIYGEERTHIVPTGRGERRRFRIIQHADAFIDPRSLELGDAAREAWRRLIAQCVAFQPGERPRDGRAFAAELGELMASHELPGRMALRGGPGRLCRNVEAEKRIRPSWVVYDRS